MKYFTVELKLRVRVAVDEDILPNIIVDFVQELRYEIDSCTEGVTIRDTEIIDYDYKEAL